MMVYVCFNIGLFAALVAITAGHFPAGVGFGLFGVLSIIRLRSQPFTTAQIGYFFLILVLALVNGLSGRDLVLSATLSAALLVTVSLADHPAMHPRVHTTRLVLDRAYGDSAESCAPLSPDEWRATWLTSRSPRSMRSVTSPVSWSATAASTARP